MTESIKDFFKKELLVCNLEAENAEDVFKKSSEILFENGFVKESFFSGLVEREKVFPTGLNIGKYNVAIPHTDIVHVNKPAISIITLKNPVKFRSMDGNGDVDVSIVFTMALSEAHSHLTMLQQLMQLFQNESILEGIMNKKSENELYDFVINIDFK